MISNSACPAGMPLSVGGVHFHFVGIKGTGMAALVEILHARGAVITGSDVQERFYTDEVLERLGIKAVPFSGGNITDSVQYVVYSSAYSPESNPDLVEALRRGIPMMLYSEALGALSATAFSAGVCGVHGKTTTTGMVGTILRGLDIPAQVLAGSVISSFGGTCTMTNGAMSRAGGAKPYFVAETCEYQRHFMSFHPMKIILTSVESDHQDFYPTYADIRDAFVDYACLLPEGGTLIYCADDAGACEVAGIVAGKRSDIALVPYGVNADGPYRLEFGTVRGGTHTFFVESLGECGICVPGDHNVRNACAAAALCAEILRSAGKNPSDFAGKIKEGLRNFSGGAKAERDCRQGKNAARRGRHIRRRLRPPSDRDKDDARGLPRILRRAQDCRGLHEPHVHEDGGASR